MHRNAEISFSKNHERFSSLLEELDALCANVNAPKGVLEHIQFFCGENGTIEELNERNDERMILFKKIASLLYGYIRIADQLEMMKCPEHYIEHIEQRIDFYIMLRELIRCNVQLIHFAPGLILYESTISLFNNYLYLVRMIQKEEHSPLGIRYINSRLDHYIKLREIICFDNKGS